MKCGIENPVILIKRLITVLLIYYLLIFAPLAHSSLGWRVRVKFSIDEVDRKCPELSKNQLFQSVEREATNCIWR